MQINVDQDDVSVFCDVIQNTVRLRLDNLANLISNYIIIKDYKFYGFDRICYGNKIGYFIKIFT